MAIEITVKQTEMLKKMTEHTMLTVILYCLLEEHYNLTLSYSTDL
jgi:hypothetical protein